MSTYDYVRTGLLCSGIDFSKIPKEKILKTCEQYNGIVSEQIYNVMVKAIQDLYEPAKIYQ